MRSFLRLLIVSIALIAITCKSSTAPSSRVARIEKVNGDRQTGAVNSTLPIPITIRTVDSNGRPVRGVWISYTVFGSFVTGDPTPSNTRTDANGIASTSWRLGAQPGEKSMSICMAVWDHEAECPTFTATATQ